MTQLAIGYKRASNGREQVSDGHMKHRGGIDSQALRAMGMLAPPSGGGLELQANPSTQICYVSAYDRDAPGYWDLSLQGRNIAIFPSGGTIQLPAAAIDGSALKPGTVTTTEIADGTIQTADIAANAVQQQQASYLAVATSAIPAGGYTESIIRATGTFAGGLVRMEWSCSFSLSTIGMVATIAIGWDGSAIYALGQWSATVANQVFTSSGTIYYSLPAGSHRVAVFVSPNGGTFNLGGNTYHTLYCTEQKR